MGVDAGAAGLHVVGGELFARGVQRGVGGAHGGAGVLELLAGHRAGGGHLLAAGEVVASPGQIGLALPDRGFEGAPGGVQRAHFAHGLGELGLGLLQRDLGVVGVEAHQRLSGLDELGVVGVDGDHGAGDLRGDLHDVARHVGVVGVFQEAPVGGPPAAPADGGEADGGGDGEEAAAAPAGGAGGGWGGHGPVPSWRDQLLVGVSGVFRARPPPRARARPALASSRRLRSSALRRRWASSGVSAASTAV